MPANDFSNAGYEKVSLLDEFDENENFVQKTPIDEIGVNEKNFYKSLVSVSQFTFEYLNLITYKNILARRYRNR